MLGWILGILYILIGILFGLGAAFDEYRDQMTEQRWGEENPALIALAFFSVMLIWPLAFAYIIFAGIGRGIGWVFKRLENNEQRPGSRRSIKFGK